jgi:hypothetical protein
MQSAPGVEIDDIGHDWAFCLDGLTAREPGKDQLAFTIPSHVAGVCAEAS